MSVCAKRNFLLFKFFPEFFVKYFKANAEVKNI